jgi:3-methyladenine DNA glycosylase AlkC
MAETLKSKYGPDVPKQISEMLSRVWSDFDRKHFLELALAGYETLELMPRARQIAEALADTLPKQFDKAAPILHESLGPTLASSGSWGMSPFVYLPHVFYVAKYGLEHFEESMELQYELTQRFTAEFSLRFFIDKYPEKSLKKLKTWTTDPSVHVRRLVSEGTRPRLPWAPRLRRFQEDPTPILPLLKVLRDDPELYVRRSVANNLNDIGKDNPKLLYQTLAAWKQEQWEHGTWIVRHALRSAVKRGDVGALKLLGVGDSPQVKVGRVALNPRALKIGTSLDVSFELTSTKKKTQSLEVDLVVHFVKASGKKSPKVFKLKNIQLQPGASESFRKKISFAQLTTRTVHPGVHTLEIQVNGRTFGLGKVTVSR